MKWKYWTIKLRDHGNQVQFWWLRILPCPFPIEKIAVGLREFITLHPGVSGSMESYALGSPYFIAFQNNFTDSFEFSPIFEYFPQISFIVGKNFLRFLKIFKVLEEFHWILFEFCSILKKIHWILFEFRKIFGVFHIPYNFTCIFLNFQLHFVGTTNLMPFPLILLSFSQTI